MRRYYRSNRTDWRIRDCSSNFPENRRIAAQHAWMWSLFSSARRRGKQQSPQTPTQAAAEEEEEPAMVSPDVAATKEADREGASQHKCTALSESSLSALLAGMPSPPLHRQSSLDKTSKTSKHRSSYEQFPPVPLEISFPFSSSEGSEASFDPATLCLGVSTLATACDQVQMETLDWEDDSVLPEDTHSRDDSSWQHHYEMPDTIHNSTTTHDSTWGMTTTTLEDRSSTVEKQRAATWSGGNSWDRSPIAANSGSKRVRFA